MKEDFIFSINVVLPLFLCCITGYVARRCYLVSEAFVTECSHVVFYIAIPSNIFLSISGSKSGKVLNMNLLIFVLTAILLVSFVLVLINGALIKDGKIAATMALCMFRSNFAMLGIPLAISLMGQAGASPTMVMVPFATILYTILSVGILVMTSGKSKGSKGEIMWNAWKEVIKNPLIIASLASIFTALFYIKLPPFVNGTIENFADMSAGLALFMLGAQLNMQEATERLVYTVPVVLVRLILVPILVVGAAVLLGFRGSDLACVFIIFSAPTAINSYILADRMGGDGNLAGDAVLLTSFMAVITLTAGIFIMRTMQLI